MDGITMRTPCFRHCRLCFILLFCALFSLPVNALQLEAEEGQLHRKNQGLVIIIGTVLLGQHVLYKADKQDRV